MNRLCLLLTTIGLGACAATVGEPAYVSSPNYEGRVTTRWVTLADHYSAETPSQQIMTRGLGELRRIRIEGAGGAPVIDKIVIDYENMQPQTVRIGRQLSPGEGETIRLNGRGADVKRVIVHTDPQYGGRYNVYGG